jgi:hypothetical protein
MFFQRSKEREFRMVWQVNADGKTGYLAGTAHFFPYSFKKSLAQLIKGVETVLLEGPLDESNMNLVREYGLEEAQDGPSPLLASLDRDTIARINREFEEGHPIPNSSFVAYLEILKTRKEAAVNSEIAGLKPWLAFFKIWTHFLRKRGWTYSVDMEAYEAARQLGKEVRFLETIEEQVRAMEGIPLERILNFLTKMDTWEQYAKRHSKYYLAGDYDSIVGIVTEYPTRCESIIDRRDPVLFERMKPYMEKGDAIAFVGTTHISGVTKMLEESGYRVSKYER